MTQNIFSVNLWSLIHPSLTLVPGAFAMFLFFKFHLFPYEAKSGSWSISNKSLVTRRPSFYCTMIIGDTNLNNSSIIQRSSSISIFYIWFEANYCSDFNEHFVGGVLYSKCKWMYQNMQEFWHEFQFLSSWNYPISCWLKSKWNKTRFLFVIKSKFESDFDSVWNHITIKIVSPCNILVITNITFARR